MGKSKIRRKGKGYWTLTVPNENRRTMIKIFIPYLIISFFFIPFSNLNAQIITFDHGTVEFYTATAISDIEAVTEKVDVILDLQTGKVEIKIPIKSFKFEYDVMEEHFNEKYLESDKFPNALFQGKILQNISSGIENEIEVDATGKLTIHGISKEIKLKAKISRQGEFKIVKARIPVVFKDYNVDEPSILSKSVAKDVEVNAILYLK